MNYAPSVSMNGIECHGQHMELMAALNFSWCGGAGSEAPDGLLAEGGPGGTAVGIGTAAGTCATGTRLSPGRGEKVASFAIAGTKTAAMEARRRKKHA